MSFFSSGKKITKLKNRKKERKKETEMARENGSEDGKEYCPISEQRMKIKVAYKFDEKMIL